MMQQEGFQDDDEDGLIAELEGMDTRASDLAADDLSRSQSQACPLPKRNPSLPLILHVC